MGYVYIGALAGVCLFFIVCLPLLPFIIVIGIVGVMLAELRVSLYDMVREYLSDLRRLYAKIQSR